MQGLADFLRLDMLGAAAAAGGYGGAGVAGCVDGTLFLAAAAGVAGAG